MRYQRLFLMATTFGLLMVGSAARAEAPQAASPLERFIQQAQQAFESAQYKKAEMTWLKAVKTLDDNGQKDAQLGNALKRLGETYVKEEKYTDAETTFKRSAEIYQALGAPDAELTQDMDTLSKSYRAVDTTLLGKDAAEALKMANVTSMTMLKNDSGNHFQIKLPDRFVKKIDDSPDVDQVGLEKIVTFDVEELPDGIIKITNIKGLKVHAKLWVNLAESQFKKNEQGERVADVTATKMGISKTVTSKLPSQAFEPIDGLVKQLRDFSTPVTASSGSSTTTTTSASTGSTTSVTTTATTGASSSPSATTTATTTTTGGSTTASTLTSGSTSGTTTGTTASTTTTVVAPGADSGTIQPVNYEPKVGLPAPGTAPSGPSD